MVSRDVMFSGLSSAWLCIHRDITGVGYIPNNKYDVTCKEKYVFFPVLVEHMEYEGINVLNTYSYIHCSRITNDVDAKLKVSYKGIWSWILDSNLSRPE